MQNILISAYAISPNHGSEPGMGWNWITQISKYCKLFIITESEFQFEIENAIKKLPQRNNLVFHYNDIGQKARIMCWNQGDWRFYYYYKKWQKKTYFLALDIIKNNQIDVVHQLNMIGYREPGYLWKIKDIPTVWGPVGGFTSIPFAFLSEFNLTNKLGWVIKNSLNQIQCITSFRLHKAATKFSAIVGATPIDKKRLTLLTNYKKEIRYIPETGSYLIDFDISQKDFTKLKIIWVGKLDERKALPIALKSISKLINRSKIEFHILGDGNNLSNYQQLAINLKISEICFWHGNIPKEDVFNLLQHSNLLFFSSIQDATSSVVLEALSYGLPVLCHDANGYGAIIDETCGFKIPFKSPKVSINCFSEILLELNENPEKLKVLLKGAYLKSQVHTWDAHAKQMIDIYQEIKQKSTYQ